MLYGTVPTPPSLSAAESVVDTLRRGVVVSYSEFGKTTYTKQLIGIEYNTQRVNSDSDPAQTDFWTPFFLFWKLAEHCKPGSRGQKFKHAIISLLVSSQIWIIWW